MRFSLSPDGGRQFEVQVQEVNAHDPDVIRTILEIDLQTFSEPTWSRHTAGLVLRHGRTFLLVADALVVGTCVCVRAWTDPLEAVLFSMALRPGWRGRGLGSFFLQQVLDALRAEGFTSVVLDVDKGNTAALRLYEQRFGFRCVAECQDDLGPGRHRQHMRLLLPGVLRESA